MFDAQTWSHDASRATISRPSGTARTVHRSLERPDATVHYWTSDPPTGASGATLVLLHGATLDHHAWAPQVEALQDNHPLVTPDLRGHGESTGRFDFVAAVDDIEELLAVLSAERVVLVGLSLGGNIAQELAGRSNPRVQAMVVADATCNTATRLHLESSMGVAALRWRAAVAGGAFAGQAAREMATDPGVQKYALEANGDRTNDEILDILASLLTGALRPDPDYRLSVPTLLAHGQRDHMGDIAGSMRAWARREPLAEHVVIPDAGHLSNLDNPEAFTEALATFLNRVQPPAEPVVSDSAEIEAQAERLYARYGGRPWSLLPEPTREHFRRLVDSGIDGQGRPLTASA